MMSDSPSIPVTLLRAADKPGAEQPGERPLSLRGWLWALSMPLWHRIKRGEGLLLAVNLSLIAGTAPSWVAVVLPMLLSVVVLSVLYLLNDVLDAERDVRDRGKDQVFVRVCLAHRCALSRALWASHVLAVTFAFAWVGVRSALASAAVLAVNWAYSRGLKGRAGIDVVWVALWGALYAMVSGVSLPLSFFTVIGLMTAVAHVFQITRDRAVDRENDVRTSAVESPWLPLAQMAFACVALTGVVWPLLGGGLALTGLLPLGAYAGVVYAGVRWNQVAWLATKGYFGGLGLLLLRALGLFTF